MPTIRPELPRDRAGVTEVLAAAFGKTDAEGRNDETRLVDRLRGEGYVRVALVAVEAGSVVGHIVFSEMAIETPGATDDEAPGRLAVLSLAPLAVAPGKQRQGLGSKLVRKGLEVCRREGSRIVLVVGHPEYYARFGFKSELARSLDDPFKAGDAFMALELEPGALEGVTGTVEYSPPLADLA